MGMYNYMTHESSARVLITFLQSGVQADQSMVTTIMEVLGVQIKVVFT